MTDIIIPGRKKGILEKDCYDFCPLDDGTKAGEKKYCALSDACRQIDILPDGSTVAMEAHYLPIVLPTGEVLEWKLFCTGQYDLRSKKERIEDDKVS